MSNDSTTGVRYKSLDFLGYPEYKIGDDGSVWRKWQDYWNRLKGGAEPRCGYKIVTLSCEGKAKTHSVHVLVLKAFVGDAPDGMECRHLDNDPRNNALSNLCWGTKKENQADRKKFGTDTSGERNGSAKLTWEVIRNIRQDRETLGLSYGKLVKKYNISKPTIHRIVTRLSWKE